MRKPDNRESTVAEVTVTEKCQVYQGNKYGRNCRPVFSNAWKRRVIGLD